MNLLRYFYALFLSLLLTPPDHSPHSEQHEDRTRVLTHGSVSTPQAGGEQLAPVNFNSNGTISDRGFTSDPECYSGTGYALRRARRHTPAHGSRQLQAPPMTEGIFLLLAAPSPNLHIISRGNSYPHSDALEFCIGNPSFLSQSRYLPIVQASGPWRGLLHQRARRL